LFVLYKGVLVGGYESYILRLTAWRAKSKPLRGEAYNAKLRRSKLMVANMLVDFIGRAGSLRGCAEVGLPIT
jgi:hypothetical protein